MDISSRPRLAARLIVRWIWLGVVFVLTLEASARLDDRIVWGAPMLGSYSNEHLVTRENGIMRGRANFRFERWGMNPAGFRGANPVSMEKTTRKRIVVMGASETFGLFEDEGAEYPARMQWLLDSIAPDSFEVINAGLPGMSLAAMVPYLSEVISPLSPDVVVLYPTPSFFLEPEPPRDSVERRKSSGLSPATEARTRFSWPTFRIVEKAKPVIKRVVPVQLQLSFRKAKLRKARSAHSTSWVWQEVPTDRMALFERQLTRVLDEIAVVGAKPVLVTHTNRFVHRSEELDDVDRQHLLAVMANYWPRASEAVVIGVDTAANVRVRALAARRNVLLVEAEGRIPPNAAHFADYSHFTNAGADILARLIVDQAILGFDR